MFNFRLSLGGLCAVVSPIVAAINLFHGQWLSATSVLLLGIGTAGLALFFSWDSHENYVLGAIFGLSTMLGIAGIFFEHRAFDLERKELHAQALAGLTTAEVNCPAPNIRKTVHNALLSCATQHYRDLSDAAFQLDKAIHLPKSVGLIDATNSALSDPDTDQCEYYTRLVYAACPYAFSGLSDSSKAILAR